MVPGTIDTIFAEPTAALWQCIQSRSKTAECLLNDSYSATFSLMIVMVILSYVLIVVTGNHSWVDRLWSIVPVMHAWLFALLPSHLHKERSAPAGFTVVTLFACLVTLWGIRLTFNYWRKGGYRCGAEDYRWEHIRQWPVFRVRAVWQLWCFSFISVYQQLLLWLIVVPLMTVPHATPFSKSELTNAAVFLGFVIVETIADQQQWNFQNAKHNPQLRRTELALDYRCGFLTHGLFSAIRHPNIWAEQQLWIVVSMVSVQAVGVSWVIVGAIGIVTLTLGSTFFTEYLSSQKYPAYAAYKKLVPMFSPKLFGRDREALDAALVQCVEKKD